MNLHKKKKSCNRCKADRNEWSSGLLAQECELGYKICWIGSPEPNRNLAIPDEPCPKPLTNPDLFFARKWYRKIKVSDFDKDKIIK